MYFKSRFDLLCIPDCVHKHILFVYTVQIFLRKKKKTFVSFLRYLERCITSTRPETQVGQNDQEKELHLSHH